MARLVLLLAGLVACDGDPAVDGGGTPACEACDRTAQCAAPLRCQGFVCVAEGQVCGGGGEGEGEGPATPVTDCPGLCEAAGLCDGLRPAGELGESVQACVAACGGGSPGEDPRVLSCLIRRVDQGLCDDDSFRECLPPWAPHLVGGDVDCAGLECRCRGFCKGALECGMFSGGGMDIDETGCQALCHNGELEEPGSLQCVEDALAAGQCETAVVMACFGLDDGGPPDREG